MKILALMITFLALSSSQALAQVNIEKWEGDIGGGTGQLILNKSPSGTTAKLDIGAEGCGGGLSGDVLETSDIITIITDKTMNPQSCVVIFAKRGNAIVAEEEQGGCMQYHGASCDFSNPHMTKRQ